MANRNTFYIQQIDIQKKLFNVTLHTFIYSIAVFFITASMLNFECIPICIMDLHKIHEQYRSTRRATTSNQISMCFCVCVCVCATPKKGIFSTLTWISFNSNLFVGIENSQRLTPTNLVFSWRSTATYVNTLNDQK